MKEKDHVSVPYWRTTFANGESAAIARAIKEEQISQGPVVAAFERQLADYLKVPYVVATTSGSMALLMSLLAADIGPGDEVIVPNRTWIATGHAPHLLGAAVKLVDVEASRPIIDARLIEAAITEKTKAIIPVHLGGRAADMRVINQIAERANLVVIEDAAQALGSRNGDGFLGTQSDMGCFSLSVAKIISTGQGGFVVTRDERIFDRLVSMRTQGVGDVVNAVWDQPGFNFRFTDILASIGLEQLKQLPNRIDQVKKIYQMYRNSLLGFNKIKLIPVNVEDGEIPIYVEALCKNREELSQFLNRHDIQCRPFYPNLNTAKHFKNSEHFPNSLSYQSYGIYLPSGPEQPINNITRVINLLEQYERI
jgi:perosamine synthetase